MTNEQQPRCKHPHCQMPVMHTYTDAYGNELPLCDTHYYEAVMNTLSSISRVTKHEPPENNTLKDIFFK